MQIGYAFALALLLFSAPMFYWYQNNVATLGGEISFVKSCWLALVIFYWLALPTLVLSNQKLNTQFKVIYALVLTNTLLRFVVEALMLFVIGGWIYQYGISHNIFSILLISFLILRASSKTSWSILSTNLVFILFSFIAETLFALYMLTMMSSQDKSLRWFVPSTSDHLQVNFITLIALVILGTWIVIFYFLWVREKNVKNLG